MIGLINQLILIPLNCANSNISKQVSLLTAFWETPAIMVFSGVWKDSAQVPTTGISTYSPTEYMVRVNGFPRVQKYFCVIQNFCII